MSSALEQVGVIVVMQKATVPALARLAVRRRWSLIHLPTAIEVKRAIGRRRVDVAIVHIAVDLQETVELVRWLRMTRQDILLVAVASAHHPEAERLIRGAGAHCYLAQADDVTVERAVSDILRQAAVRGESRHDVDSRSTAKRHGLTRGRTVWQGA